MSAADKKKHQDETAHLRRVSEHSQLADDVLDLEQMVAAVPPVVSTSADMEEGSVKDVFPAAAAALPRPLFPQGGGLE